MWFAVLLMRDKIVIFDSLAVCKLNVKPFIHVILKKATFKTES
jgi:hypothetical protein